MGKIQEELKLAKDYELKTEDVRINGKTIKLVNLTQDNIARVEAMIRMDSSYAKTGEPEVGPEGTTNKIKFYGSTAFWMTKLKEAIETEKYTYKSNNTNFDIIQEAVNAVDRENSTHLNSNSTKFSTEPRVLMRNRIQEIIENPDEQKNLKNRLENRDLDLVCELSNTIREVKDNEEINRGCTSFSSKFCHYACLWFFGDKDANDNFSIYDNILFQVLPIYEFRYCKTKILKKVSEDDFYKNYSDVIDRIREAAKNEYGQEISRNGFDHLLWYYHKGHSIRGNKEGQFNLNDIKIQTKKTKLYS